jgi:hypothetical protein
MNPVAGVGHERFMFCHLSVLNRQPRIAACGERVNQFTFARTAKR